MDEVSGRMKVLFRLGIILIGACILSIYEAIEHPLHLPLLINSKCHSIAFELFFSVNDTKIWLRLSASSDLNR